MQRWEYMCDSIGNFYDDHSREKWLSFVRWYAFTYCDGSSCTYLRRAAEWVYSLDLARVAIIAATGCDDRHVADAVDEWFDVGCPEVDE